MLYSVEKLDYWTVILADQERMFAS